MTAWLNLYKQSGAFDMTAWATLFKQSGLQQVCLDQLDQADMSLIRSRIFVRDCSTDYFFGVL